MQAYKLKGIVDEAGNLAIASPVKMPPCEVEIIEELTNSAWNLKNTVGCVTNYV